MWVPPHKLSKDEMIVAGIAVIISFIITALTLWDEHKRRKNN